MGWWGNDVMGLWLKLTSCGVVAAIAIAAALRVSPVEVPDTGAHPLSLAPVISEDAYPRLVTPPPSGPALQPRETALAVPVHKPPLPAPPVTEAVAVALAQTPAAIPQFDGIERPAPSGYIDFCHRRPDICAVGGARQVALTSKRWDELVAINSHYDETITPKTDLEALGLVEHWDIPSGRHPVGDCEDFALAKKASLISQGWPRSALLLAVANIPGADIASRRHAVLIVVTDQGNFVLDNRRLKILTWEEAGYDWVSIQSPSDAYRWVAISTDANSKIVTASGVPDITRTK